jgi:hypothetical protein
MKKLILALALLASVPAFAQHRHHGHHGHHGGYRGPSWGPVVGGMILGAVVYDIYNRPVVVQQQPVIVQNPSPIYQSQPNCGPWKEVQSQDGTIYRERTCNQ